MQKGTFLEEPITDRHGQWTQKTALTVGRFVSAVLCFLLTIIW